MSRRTECEKSIQIAPPIPRVQHRSGKQEKEGARRKGKDGQSDYASDRGKVVKVLVKRQ